MNKIILTKEQKERWVREDYANGRIHAMDTLGPISDPTLVDIFTELSLYENFGSGDETETKLWKKILNYLSLEEAYTNYWEDAL